MIIIRSTAVKYLFRVNNAPFIRYKKKIDGLFFYRNRYWFDVVLLKRKITSSVIIKFLVDNYSIPFSEVGVSLPRIDMNRRIKLAMLMLTIKEASVLTRIPEEAFSRAVLLGELKIVSLGAHSFIPRHELERLLGFILNEEKVREVVISTLIRTRKRFI